MNGPQSALVVYVPTLRASVPGALLFLISLTLIATTALGYSVQIRVQDTQGNLIPARVHVLDANYYPQPDHADSTLLVHYDSQTGSYFYVDHPITLSLVPGVAHITAGRGFEWKPVTLNFNVQRDTTAVLTLSHTFDLREEGWFSGDKHMHTYHDPIIYQITPATMHRIAQSEDLSMSWLLDGTYHFTGGPDPVSTPDAVLYYATEWRNQAYGHVALLGLKSWIGQECCTPPFESYPMLSDLREQWNPDWDEAMCLNHPHSTSDFMMDDNWPGWGLGRETPVLAASNNLDAYDIAAYTNANYVWTTDWYSLLNCGFQIPPSAGTDAVIDAFYCAPPGGYRVYVKETGSHDAAHWVEGLKAGRVFVTNYPLIPEFTVDGAEAGSVLNRPGAQATVSVHMRVVSNLAVSSVNLLRNGQVVASYPISWSPNGTVWENTANVNITQSSWLALRTTGTTSVPHCASHSLFAHTGAVYVKLNDHAIESSADAGRFLDWIDSLQVFVDRRDNWDGFSQQAVYDRLNAARGVFTHTFRVPPLPPTPLAPAQGDTLSIKLPIVFDWSDAVDPEPGDAVHYDLELAPDSSFFEPFGPDSLVGSSYVMTRPPLFPSHIYWWRVWSIDRGGNRTLCDGRCRWFRFEFRESAGVEDPPKDGQVPENGGALRLAVWPNPSPGPFHLRLESSGSVPASVEIFDARGCLIRHFPLTTAGTRPTGGSPLHLGEAVWDGKDAQQHPVPAGIYWAACSRGSAASGASGKATIVVIR